MPTVKEEDREHSLEDVPMGDDNSVKEEDSETILADALIAS
jgi:hypothetical protein